MAWQPDFGSGVRGFESCPRSGERYRFLGGALEIWRRSFSPLSSKG